jgi:hypothetical protein
LHRSGARTRMSRESGAHAAEGGCWRPRRRCGACAKALAQARRSRKRPLPCRNRTPRPQAGSIAHACPAAATYRPRWRRRLRLRFPVGARRTLCRGRVVGLQGEARRCSCRPPSLGAIHCARRESRSATAPSTPRSSAAEADPVSQLGIIVFTRPRCPGSERGTSRAMGDQNGSFVRPQGRRGFPPDGPFETDFRAIFPAERHAHVRR